jgi:hypothetical protein
MKGIFLVFLSELDSFVLCSVSSFSESTGENSERLIAWVSWVKGQWQMDCNKCMVKRCIRATR